MGQAGWPWARLVMSALGDPTAKPSADALKVWRRLPEWEDQAPPPAPGSLPVEAAEARTRLARMLGPDAEQRPGQADYASAATHAFLPREAPGNPQVVLAEAGTGTGKTLAYVAPASLWAERNGGSVWISTFTRHLQRQIDGELQRLFPDPAERRRRVVVRKGRENYLCLLNYEDHVNSASVSAGSAGRAGPGVPLGAWRRRTGTCRAATCRAGSRNCSGSPCCRPSPTAGASASTAPARTTAPASWSTPSAGHAGRSWWWRTTRW